MVVLDFIKENYIWIVLVISIVGNIFAGTKYSTIFKHLKFLVTSIEKIDDPDFKKKIGQLAVQEVNINEEKFDKFVQTQISKIVKKDE